MPDQASPRYEQHDFPGFKAEMGKLCPDCKVLYQNANADVATQQQQFNSVIAQGAKVVVLDPVDWTAAASLVRMAQSQDVKVIAYDRPVPSTPADYYVSFDSESIGHAIAQSLVQSLYAVVSIAKAACRAGAPIRITSPLAFLIEGDSMPRRHRAAFFLRHEQA